MARKRSKQDDADASKKLTRDQSLAARPQLGDIRSRIEMKNGGERIEVPYQPTGMQKLFLRGRTDLTRTYELDPMGVEVLGMCDGSTSVRVMAKKFARKHDLNKAEAETAVITFLRTMMTKGIVTMIVPKRVQ